MRMPGLKWGRTWWLAAFAGEKSEVSAGSQPGAVNWRRWR